MEEYLNEEKTVAINIGKSKGIKKKKKKQKIMDGQLERIDYEVKSNTQWKNRAKGCETFKKYTQSKKTIQNLTRIFQMSYEKGGYASTEKRVKRASHWKKILT